MARYGKYPFLECSSRGDKRFSAFYARVNGRSIEETYQAAKVFPGGLTGCGWRYAKGRPCTNPEEVKVLYAALWDQYMEEHPELGPVIDEATGLSDTFAYGQPNQAAELWRIKLERKARSLV